MMLDGDGIRRRMNRSARPHDRRLGIQVFEIGQNGAQHDQAIRLVDEFLDLVASDQAAIDPDKQRMVLTDDRLAEQRRGHRNIDAFDEVGNFFLEMEAMDLGADQQDGPLYRGQHLAHFRDRLGQRRRIAVVDVRDCFRCTLVNGRMDEIAWNLDVHGPLVADQGRQRAVDHSLRRQRIVEDDRRHGDLLEDFFLRREVPHHVMQQGIPHSLTHPRRSGQQHDGRTFGVGARDCVHRVQASDTVRHAGASDAVQPGIAVGCEAGAVFSRGPDVPDR